MLGLYFIHACMQPKLFGSSVSCKLYADDVKLYSVIQTEQDASELQSSFDALVAWSDQWQLSISSKKSAVLAYVLVKHTLISVM